MKGKSAIYIARELGNSRNATGHISFGREDILSQVLVRDEEVIRRYISPSGKRGSKARTNELVPGVALIPLKGSLLQASGKTGGS